VRKEISDPHFSRFREPLLELNLNRNAFEIPGEIYDEKVTEIDATMEERGPIYPVFLDVFASTHLSIIIRIMLQSGANMDPKYEKLCEQRGRQIGFIFLAFI
jgi:hypothetical protein